MSAWVRDADGEEGIYGRVFNSPHDSLGSVLDSFMVGINMNEALSDPVLAPPIIAHISNAISKVASRSASGFNIFIDEGANLLQNDGFKSVVQVMFREYRKLNGVVGMAFQDPEALAKTGIADAVLQNVSTMFFFPNAMAGPDTYTPYNLNAEQLEFINKGSEGRGREVLVVKRDPATGWEESVILNIDLAPLGDAVRFYRAGTDAIQQMEALQQQWGEEWRRHL
jgi:type IV secretion system protein VirB4